ncbi:zinc ribbon domain-containing protein [Actinokineospora xionganensis]
MWAAPWWAHLADRAWTCGGCGAVHDRDRNAATNLLAAMLANAG